MDRLSRTSSSATCSEPTGSAEIVSLSELVDRTAHHQDYYPLAASTPHPHARDRLIDEHASLRLVEKISSAAAKFSLELDMRKLFQLLAGEASQILGAERTIIWSVVDGRLRRECWIPESTLDWPPIENMCDDGLRAFRQCEAVLTQPQLGAGLRIRNSIFAPLVGTQNRLLAIIEVQNKRHSGFFNEHDLQVATCLARVACSAVDRARLFDRIEEWSRSIEMLLSFNATVNRQLKPQEMVRQLVINAAGFIDADGGSAGIASSNETERTMECDGLYYNGQWHSYVRLMRAGEGVPGTVLQTEFPILIEDYRQHPLADHELASRFGFGSCICVAIKNASERVLGFFELYRRTGKPAFNWQEAALLESLGNIVAVAIENARLVRSLELKNEQVKNLSAAHVRRLEEERQHIARELHDETGQVLVGLKLRLQLLSRSLTPEQLEARQVLDVLREQVGQATIGLKNLAKRLRPPTLDELGFEATVRQLVAEYHQQVKFDIRLVVDDMPRLSKEAETALYRILQESLTNIVKHAEASSVEIHFGRQSSDYVYLSIQDDGVGFDLEQSTTGLGLVGIRERVKMLDGRIKVYSAKGKGTRIEVNHIAYAQNEEDHTG